MKTIEYWCPILWVWLVSVLSVLEWLLEISMEMCSQGSWTRNAICFDQVRFMTYWFQAWGVLWDELN